MGIEETNQLTENFDYQGEEQPGYQRGANTNVL